MSSKEIRGAAIKLIEAATHRRREEMIIKLGREFYDLSAAHNRAKLDSFVDLRSPVNGGEQDTNGEASPNSSEEEEKETATPPSSVDQQTADDTSVTWELLDPETGSKCPDMKERDGEKARVGECSAANSLKERRNVPIKSSSSPAAVPSSGPSSWLLSGPLSGPSPPRWLGPSTVL